MWLVATVLDIQEPLDPLWVSEETELPFVCWYLRGPQGRGEGA